MVAALTTHDEAGYWSKIAVFSYHTCIRRPRRNIAVTFGKKKLEWCGYPMMKIEKFEDMFNRFDVIHERDGRTDKRTDTARRHRPRLCTASRGNQ